MDDVSVRPASGPVVRTRAADRSGSRGLTDETVTRLLRIWMANRGIWEALPGAGPTVPIPAVEADVDRYVDAHSALLSTLTS